MTQSFEWWVENTKGKGKVVRIRRGASRYTVGLIEEVSLCVLDVVEPVVDGMLKTTSEMQRT